MGMFDSVMVPCPACGAPFEAQSKGGECRLAIYQLDDAPADVLGDINRHAPFECDQCHEIFEVRHGPAVVVPVRPQS